MNEQAKLSRRSIILVALLIVYGPYCWLLLMDYPWNSYRLLLLKMWLLLPGVVSYFIMLKFVPEAWLLHRTDASLYIFATLFTVIILTVVIVSLLRIRRGFWLLAVGIFVLSCVFGFLAYSLMRA